MFDWYKIFNLQNFLESNLVSRNIDAILEGIGEEKIMITRGCLVSIVFRDVILPIDFEGKNPFEKDGYASFKDDNGNVWLGIKVS